MVAEEHNDVLTSKDECMVSIGNYLNRGGEQISHMIDEKPAQSLLITGLAGFAVGLVLSRLITPESSVRSSFNRSTAERFGRQLLDRVEQAMPNMIRDRLHK